MVLQSRTAAKHTSRARNSRGLTGNMRHSRAARGFPIIKFLLLVQSIHLALQVLNLRQEVIHCREFIFLWRIKFICPQLSSSFRPFTANSALIFNFEAIFGVTFLIKSALRHGFFKYSSRLVSSPVHFHFSFRESSLSHAFTFKSSPGFSFKVIVKVLSLTEKPFLFRWRRTSKFTISLSFQLGFLNV